MVRPLTFGIVGVGFMGRRHIEIARQVGFEVAGLFDPSPDAVAKALAEHALSKSVVFDSTRTMIDTVRPQALVVASTAPGHCEAVCYAAEVGVRYILCEKPMAASVCDCDRMIEACAKSDSVLGINHQMRYMEQYSAVKALVASPELGGLRSMTVVAGNIGFAMNASHYVEAFRYLTDEPVKTVSAWLDSETVPNPRGPQYSDRSGQLRAVTASGKRLSMEIGGDQGHGLQVIYGCRYGQIFSDQLSGLLRISCREAQYRDLPTTRYGMPAAEETRAIAQANVVAPTVALWQAMRDGGSFPTGADGRHSVAAIVAANVSGEQGGVPVALADVPVDRVFSWA